MLPNIASGVSRNIAWVKKPNEHATTLHSSWLLTVEMTGQHFSDDISRPHMSWRATKIRLALVDSRIHNVFGIANLFCSFLNKLEYMYVYHTQNQSLAIYPDWKSK